MARGRSLRWLRCLRGDQGATLVEFAVILPVLGVMLMAAVDFGRLVATSVALSNAVKAGVQYGAQSTAASASTTGMTAAARADFSETAFGTLTVDSAKVLCRCPGSTAMGTCASVSTTCGATPQAYVVVGAQRSVELMLRYPGYPASLPVRRSAILRVQ